MLLNAKKVNKPMQPKHYHKSTTNAMSTYLSADDRLLHLAEEACELGHAALKLARVKKGTNPADIDIANAQKNLLEEYADVLYCADSLNLRPMDTRFDANSISKKLRK